MESILANFGLPDRFIYFLKRVHWVHRTYRRRIGGAVWKRLDKILRSALQFPDTLLCLEIRSRVIHVDLSNFGFRDSIEAIFNDMIELVEISAKQSLTMKDARAFDPIESLTDLLCYDWWHHSSLYGSPNTVERISKVKARIARTRADLLSCFSRVGF